MPREPIGGRRCARKLSDGRPIPSHACCCQPPCLLPARCRITITTTSATATATVNVPPLPPTHTHFHTHTLPRHPHPTCTPPPLSCSSQAKSPRQQACNAGYQRVPERIKTLWNVRILLMGLHRLTTEVYGWMRRTEISTLLAYVCLF